MTSDLQLTVARVPVGSTLGTGQVFALTTETRIGRAPGMDLVLADRTISRQHARVWPAEAGWRIANISSRNGVFVDTRPVEPGGEAPLHANSRLQIGGVIFAVAAVEETMPVTEPLITPRPRTTLTVRRDGDACTAHWGGRLMPLPPAAALALYALARQPGAVVHEWDIQNAIGRECNLPQAVSGIRRAIRNLVRDGVVTVDDLAALVAQAAAAEVSATDPATVARQLIRARRKHGYALMLPKTAVRCEDVG